jgi:N utilization substance protein B
MISRRNIRVKVMQTLYTLHAASGDSTAKARQGTALLEEKLVRSLDLFLVSILYTFRTAQYAEIDARQRAAKYLPTAEDLQVSTKIAENTLLLQIASDPAFQEVVEKRKLEHYVDEEWVRKIYQLLVKSPEGIAYAADSERPAAKEKAILQFIWEKLILTHEGLMEYFSEELPGWEDDREMVEIMMEHLFRNSTRVNFRELISKEKNQYAHELLRTALDKEEYCMELIKPRLINWDPERVALIDLLLLQMGVCELLYFPTIPTRVTINEYIEIAKQYSTLQSGQFVNGVLDNIMKDLEKENRIHKEDRSRKS